jgi:hypothetical protein
MAEYLRAAVVRLREQSAAALLAGDVFFAAPPVERAENPGAMAGSEAAS